MRFIKIGLDVSILVTVFFLLINGFFLLIEADFLSYLQFIRSPFFCFSSAIISFFLAISLAYFFISLHKKNMLSVRFKVKNVDVDSAIIKAYLEKSFRSLDIPIENIDVEVDRSQKLYIHIHSPKLPKMEYLPQIEKEVGGMLGANLGYQKDFEIYFSQKA